MKRWHWFTAILAAAVVLALALVAVARTGDGAHPAAAQTPPFLSVDMDVTNGTGPCNPIDSSATHAVGAIYKVAVCLSGSTAEPAAIEFQLAYNGSLNECVPATSCTGTALDCNPDANVGTTTFSNPGLGGGWDCSGGAPPQSLPSCASVTGLPVAHMSCLSVLGPFTLPVGTSVNAAIAEIEFTALGSGTDTLTLQSVVIADTDASVFLDCDTSGECIDGTDIKTGATAVPPTPTSTPVPPTATTEWCGPNERVTCAPTPRAFTPTPTEGPTETPTVPAAPTTPPVGPTIPPVAPGGGQLPIVAPPNTGNGAGSAPWTLPMASFIALMSVATLVGGGFYLRYARKR